MDVYVDDRGKETVTQFEHRPDGRWFRTSLHTETGKVYSEDEIPQDAVPKKIWEEHYA